MNMKYHFCLTSHLLPAIALHQTQQNWKCLHYRNRQCTEFHIPNVWSRRSIGRKPRFFLVRWDLTFKQILITKPKKSSSKTSGIPF